MSGEKETDAKAVNGGGSTPTNELGNAVALDFMFILSVLAVILASIAICVAVATCKRRKETGESATPGMTLLGNNGGNDVLSSSSELAAAASSKKRIARPSKKGQNKRGGKLFGSQGSVTIDNPAARIELTNVEMVGVMTIHQSKSKSLNNPAFGKRRRSTGETKFTEHDKNKPHRRASTKLPTDWQKHSDGTGRPYYN
jgi:hypothetical protein